MLAAAELFDLENLVGREKQMTPSANPTEIRGGGTAVGAVCTLLLVLILTAAPAAAVTPATAALGEPTRQTLRQLRLDGLWPAHSDLVLRALDLLAADSGSPEQLAAFAELALLRARHLEGRDPNAAGGWSLVAAARTYGALYGPENACKSRSEPLCGRLAELYRRAASGVLTPLLPALDGRRERRYPVLDQACHLRIDRRAGRRDPDAFDRLLPAAALPAEGLRQYHLRPGVGVPLVGIREDRGRSPEEGYYPPGGLASPLTAVLRFADRGDGIAARSCSAVLSLHDPRRASTVLLGGEAVPLAADFTAPIYAHHLASGFLGRLGRIGFLATEKALPHEGLLLLEDYDPGKIPVVMIHGLRSSPHTWAELTNDLRGDPHIRAHFQVWHYFYPTGLPFLYAAHLLREELAAVRRALDPNGTDAASRSMVLIAHSMGGLLARALVSDSGTAIWEAAVTVPPEELAGRPMDVETLRRCYVFEPLPYVDRVIFIATPHRGVRLADALAGRLAAALVRRPRQLRSSFQRVAAGNGVVLRPAMRRLLTRGGPTSVDSLSPRYPPIRRLADLPIAPGVATHSILGDLGLARGGGRRGSDGRVPRTSAHLAGAISELVLPARHNVHSHPLAIAEVQRILRQHLRTPTTGAPST